MEIFIGLLIISYAGFVIYKKVKNIKSGKYCSCGCSECPSKVKCMDDIEKPKSN